MKPLWISSSAALALRLRGTLGLSFGLAPPRAGGLLPPPGGCPLGRRLGCLFLRCLFLRCLFLRRLRICLLRRRLLACRLLACRLLGSRLLGSRGRLG